MLQMVAMATRGFITFISRDFTSQCLCVSTRDVVDSVRTGRTAVIHGLALFTSAAPKIPHHGRDAAEITIGPCPAGNVPLSPVNFRERMKRSYLNAELCPLVATEGNDSPSLTLNVGSWNAPANMNKPSNHQAHQGPLHWVCWFGSSCIILLTNKEPEPEPEPERGSERIPCSDGVDSPSLTENQGGELASRCLFLSRSLVPTSACERILGRSEETTFLYRHITSSAFFMVEHGAF
ncbi:unnamed protein product [Pleuronectes platessa]|uniref:Uncharacterized protein n=1 Tax=Pleuronectes platessa TaxID=8262 RepID=A0A9N7U7Q6_PLEPL|nr:unnamed protein product [Pleuronectes platessa]